nr:MAG TPA: hypothetical protein [Caudoviricetes sp.]
MLLQRGVRRFRAYRQRQLISIVPDKTLKGLPEQRLISVAMEMRS